MARRGLVRSLTVAALIKRTHAAESVTDPVIRFPLGQDELRPALAAVRLRHADHGMLSTTIGPHGGPYKSVERQTCDSRLGPAWRISSGQPEAKSLKFSM